MFSERGKEALHDVLEWSRKYEMLKKEMVHAWISNTAVAVNHPECTHLYDASSLVAKPDEKDKWVG